jgi:cell division transport system permease protein
MRAIRYAFDEATLSLWRGRQSGLLSMATIAVALFVLGGFLLIVSNLERLSDEWSRSAEASVYLDDDVTVAERKDVERLLAPGRPETPGSPVESFEFVTKEQARQRFKQTFTDLGAALDSLETNPLPASYEVRIQPASDAPSKMEALILKLRASAGVADVRYDRQWLDRLLSAVTVIRSVGLLLGVLLTFAAALTVANVVRLALYSRRDEIAIMQLVGAPRSFVRGPFVMEGVLQGGIGAVAALAALAGAFLIVSARYLEPLAVAVNVSSFHFLPLELCLALLLGGMAVGWLGGTVAAAGRT